MPAPRKMCASPNTAISKKPMSCRNSITPYTPPPKSNSVVAAIDAARADVRAGKSGNIPREMQNVHADGTGFEREQGYKYPHNYPGHWVRQQYLPDSLKNAHYYEYGDNKTEQAAKAYWELIKK